MKITLRNMSVYSAAVSNVGHAAIIPEVSHALVKWVKSKVGFVAPGVLIGGLAMSFYARPRATTAVDLLFLTEETIPSAVYGFKRHRKGAFEEKDTQVEIEVNTSKSFNLPAEVANKVFSTAVTHDGLRVASKEAMVVLKLYGSDNAKRLHKDLADIIAIIENFPDVSVDDWSLEPRHVDRLAALRQSIA